MESLVFLVLGGFFAGFIDSIAGGGGLISLPMLLALGLDPRLALGTNKIIGISASMTSSIRYGVSRTIQWRIGIPMALAGLAGGCLGALSVTYINTSFLRPFVFVALCAVAVYMLMRPKIGSAVSRRRLVHWAWPFVVGLTVGYYDGFFGPGTGTFLMLGMVTLFGQTLLGASASARLVNYATNLGALIIFTHHGLVAWRFAWPACLAAFCGAYIGSSMSIKKGVAVIRPVYLLVVILLIVKLAWDLF